MTTTQTNARTPARLGARLAATAAIAAGLVALSAGPALARTGDVDTSRQTLEGKIDARLAQLARLHSRTDASKTVTADDRTAIDGILANETSGLTELRAHVAEADDLRTLAEDARSMVDDYRVYVVVTPQVHLTLGADGVSAIVDRFRTRIEPKLDAAIARAKAAGRDTTAAESARVQVGTHVDAAATDVDGLSPKLLALEPHGYPGNHDVVVDARGAVGAARTELAAARAAARQVVDDLQ